MARCISRSPKSVRYVASFFGIARRNKTGRFPRRATHVRHALVLAFLLPAIHLSGTAVRRAQIGVPAEAISLRSPEALLAGECPGWFPDDFGLKDHTVFEYDGLYYIASIYLGSDGYEDRFAYAASSDLCHWQVMDGILQTRPAGDWDEFRIWAPFVYEENGVYYLYYTGVTESIAQSIMLATSTNPADPDSWVRQGVMFQPDHPGSVWEGFDKWSDCRDPTVFKIGALYHMYYTGLDVDGGIVGLATAPTPAGPWTDQGAVMTKSEVMLESPTLAFFDGMYYLFYHQSSQVASRPVYHYGQTPSGPWSEAFPLFPGWAHEVWMGQDAHWYTSFLTDYSITIRPLTWNDYYQPPRPFIGAEIHRFFLPQVQG
jgi:hypothetical protein